MSFTDGKVAAGGPDEIRNWCMKKCGNIGDKNKDRCYSQCVSSYNYDKCQHYRRSNNLSMGRSGNFYPCMDFIFWEYSSGKYFE